MADRLPMVNADQSAGMKITSEIDDVIFLASYHELNKCGWWWWWGCISARLQITF